MKYLLRLFKQWKSNMDKTNIIQKIRSGVIHIEFLNGKNVIASGSGFLSHGYLITNNHVYMGSTNTNTTSVRLAWHPEANTQSIEGVTIPVTTFQSYLKTGSDENYYDYAILNVPELQDKGLYNFPISLHNTSNILDEVLILGFPLEHQNLVCHRGTISSFYSKNGIDIIQLDASVNASNSGGPLVDIKTENVIGIVTRKGTGLTKIFDELLLTLDANIKAAENAPGGVIIGGIDPRQALIAGQNQVKTLAREILRSANVGIGYAFSVEYIADEMKQLKNKN